MVESPLSSGRSPRAARAGLQDNTRKEGTGAPPSRRPVINPWFQTAPRKAPGPVLDSGRGAQSEDCAGGPLLFQPGVRFGGILLAPRERGPKPSPARVGVGWRTIGVRINVGGGDKYKKCFPDG